MHKKLEKEIARNKHDKLVQEKIDDIINNKDKYPKVYEKIKDKKSKIDKPEKTEKINENIIAYLVKISSQGLTDHDEKYMTVLHNSVNDLYREAEIADNMTKYTRHLVDDGLVFSKGVFEQLSIFKDKLSKQFSNVEMIVLEQKVDLISDVDVLEDEIDKLRSKLINEHIVRLEKGECSPVSSGVYINLVSNLERAGDHLHYMAHNIVDAI